MTLTQMARLGGPKPMTHEEFIAATARTYAGGNDPSAAMLEHVRLQQEPHRGKRFRGVRYEERGAYYHSVLHRAPDSVAWHELSWRQRMMCEHLAVGKIAWYGGPHTISDRGIERVA